MLNGVQIRDQIYDGEIKEELEGHALPDTQLVASHTIAKTLGRNKGGCLWKKGDGKKCSNKFKGLTSRKSWERKVEDRKK